MTGIWRKESRRRDWGLVFEGFVTGLCTASILTAYLMGVDTNTPIPENKQPSSKLEALFDGYDVILMNVSAYCPCEKCCGEFADGITASGKPAEGFLVAAPPNIPFGTMLSIPGYNNGLPVPVLDRGGAIKGNKLDVFFPTHQEALNWGRQFLEVRVLEAK